MDHRKGIQRVGVVTAPGRVSTDGGEDIYCPICGRDGDPALKRFGHLFCSDAHAEQYASARRARTESLEASRSGVEAKSQGQGGNAMACGIGAKGGLRKMGWCLAGGVGLLIAALLIASGGVAATAGSVLTVVAFLACPIGMYFMMRAMMKGQHNQPPDDKGEKK